MDIWCGNVPFKTRLHRLYALSDNKNGMVKDFWGSQQWTFSWRCQIRGGVESSELSALIGLLEEVKILVVPNK